MEDALEDVDSVLGLLFALPEGQVITVLQTNTTSQPKDCSESLDKQQYSMTSCDITHTFRCSWGFTVKHVSQELRFTLQGIQKRVCTGP